MRDPTQIDRVLTTIREAWLTFPDWRLGQLLFKAVQLNGRYSELFLLEDEHLEQLIVQLSADRAMTRHPFNVADTFILRGQVVISTDKGRGNLPAWLRLKIGDEIELRSEGNSVRTWVKGIEFLDPCTAETPFGFLLPPDVTQDRVTIGCEIWVTEASVVKDNENK